MLYNLIPLIPEIFLAIIACLVLLRGVFNPHKSASFSFYVTQISLVLAAITAWHIFYWTNYQTVDVFGDMFVLDKLSVTLQIFILISVFFTFCYSHLYNRDNKMAENEFYVLGLLSTIGMLFLVSTDNLLVLFLGLELMALPVYAMVAMMREKTRCIEASIKYFVLGSVASAMLLYGFSFFFGATHSLTISTISHVISISPLNNTTVFYFALVFVIAGFAFKLGAAPFHAWVADVYDGAPNSVTLFISAAPKLAAFGLAVRLLVLTVPALHLEWDHVLIAIALLSLCIGNIAAVIQTNIKRLLAYSAIAQMGFVFLGLACGTQRADAAALFYMITYAITSLGAFGMIVLLSKSGSESNELHDLCGLGSRQPWMAFMFLLFLFSLAGVPPLVGFIAKVGILEALLKAHDISLAVIAILFSVIGAYYYIRVVKVMYFEEPAVPVAKIAFSKGTVVAMSVNGLIVLLLGIFPTMLFMLCHAVFA